MPGTRSAVTHPLIGHSRSDVPSCGLPSEVELLRMIAWHREQPKSQITLQGILPLQVANSPNTPYLFLYLPILCHKICLCQEQSHATLRTWSRTFQPLTQPYSPVSLIGTLLQGTKNLYTQHPRAGGFLGTRVLRPSLQYGL